MRLGPTVSSLESSGFGFAWLQQLFAVVCVRFLLFFFSPLQLTESACRKCANAKKPKLHPVAKHNLHTDMRVRLLFVSLLACLLAASLNGTETVRTRRCVCRMSVRAPSYIRRLRTASSSYSVWPRHTRHMRHMRNPAPPLWSDRTPHTRHTTRLPAFSVTLRN